MKNTSQRINITLPDQTLQQIDKVAQKGNRSKLIDTAVNFYIGHHARARLHDALKEGALAREKRDREITELFDFSESWGNRT